MKKGTLMHVTANSKDVKSGSIFFALRGARYDGHDFIGAALAAGALKVYCERAVTGVLDSDSRIEVLGAGARRKLGELASEMYGHPTHALKMIGVTGTSGKTTTSYLIHHLFSSFGSKNRCARIGTNGAFFEGREWPTQNTTPDALSLQKWFREILDLGATHVVMEVSSHALHQDRVWGIAWDAAVFLNLSAEHLDYHANLDDYFSAKALLFEPHAEFSRECGKSAVLVANQDHDYGRRLPQSHGFSIQNQIKNFRDTPTGIAAEVSLGEKKISFECPLFGKFQIENILAALTVAAALGGSVESSVGALKNFSGVPGRMEMIPNQKGIFVFVDYAHKPEALQKVLEGIQRAQNKRIITVFGCGGDRDKTKRPVMGKIAAQLSDWVVLTSDNPRSEDPLIILKEIENGIAPQKNYEVIPDRSAAIQRGIEMARAGDIVLIAGKGHEDYQLIRTTKRHFDDREEARKFLRLN